jgi:hypothetical protein
MSAATMPEEGFLRRWARRKSLAPEEAAAEDAIVAPAPATAPVADAAPPGREPPSREHEAARPAPTLEDVARLTRESDYSAFVGQGVDRTVQRMALKKLFADPHFNVMDGLDIYIDDYNKVTPLSAEMLASLKHAPGVLSRLFGDDERDQQAGEGAAATAPETALEQAHDPDGTTPPPPLPHPGTP